MRMLGFLLALIAAGNLTASAQGRQFGVKAGPTFATLETDDPEDTDPRVAASWGGFVVLPVREPLAIQFEALFGPRGAKTDSGMPDVTATLVLDYLDLPVLARIAWPVSDRRSFHVFGGPYVGVRVKAKAELSTRIGSFRSGLDDDIGDEVRRLDTGIIVGAGMDFGRRLVVDGRYGWGLVNISSRGEVPETKHRYFSVLAGFRF